MSRAKVKEIKKAVAGAAINDMFGEMMGTKDASMDIIIPKFLELRNTIRHVTNVLLQFASMKNMRADYPSLVTSLDEIHTFATEVRSSTCVTDVKDDEEQYYALDKNEMNLLYRKLKEDAYVKKLIIMCSKLDPYKTNFNDVTKLKENFVHQEPGLRFVIFEFSTLDLKIIWNNPKTSSTVKKYILAVLSMLHKDAHSIYNIITSPDIDVDEFTDVLITAITTLKSLPALHRCKNAFARIEQSVSLLKDKFSDYYRDTVISQDPNNLITSFIVDVSNQGGTNPKLSREFATIIKFMNKEAEKSGKSKDPNIAKIFEMLNSNYALMTKKDKSTPEDDPLTDDVPTDVTFAAETEELPNDEQPNDEQPNDELTSITAELPNDELTSITAEQPNDELTSITAEQPNDEQHTQEDACTSKTTVDLLGELLAHAAVDSKTVRKTTKKKKKCDVSCQLDPTTLDEMTKYFNTAV